MVQLTENFQLECAELDKDHQVLIEMVNEITDKLDRGETENCKSHVLEFTNFTRVHFGREEQLLRKVGYPDVNKHRAHHKQLEQKLEHIQEFAEQAAVNEMARTSLKRELIFFVMDDVITTDLDFKAYIAEH